MAPRLSKRQQRERDELEALAGPTGLPHEDEEAEFEEEGDSVSNKEASRVTIGFAALARDEEEEDEQVSEGDQSVPVVKSKKSKKKKKKGAGTYEHEPSAPSTKGTKAKPKPKESAKSKGKRKAEDDDFDKALAELSGKHAISGDTGPAQTTSSLSSFDSLNSLIGVSLKHLDAETELRRFFGSKVISSSSPSHPRTSRAQASARSHLAKPQATWPPAQYGAGLFMRPLTPEEVRAKGTGVGPDPRERWWTVEASPRYKGTTYEFMQCVMGGDPQLFFSLLAEMPWHADTLLQTAEVFRHREEYATAADFLSRALFAYERAFAGGFNLTTGVHRLDFDRVENRVFYLALARNVVDLNRRGTPRTAFEFARLLFALDPHTDPHGALLHLDCLALKAGQAKWLLDVWDAYGEMRGGKMDEGESGFDVTFMPGWCWTRALVLFEKEGQADQEHRDSTEALKDAILAFPSIAPLLADKVDIILPAELRQLDAFRIVTDYSISTRQDGFALSLIHLLSHIYATRSASLWKPPARSSWLLKTLTSLSPSSFTLSHPPPHPRSRLLLLFSDASNLTDAIYRHVVVLAPLVPEFRRLTAFFPPWVKERLMNAIEGDPLLPVTSISAYDGTYFAEAGLAGRGTELGVADRMARELHRLFPDPVDRGQFQALFDAHPEIGARFPGGAIELAQLARQFPQEVLEAMVGMVVANGEGGVPGEEEGGMPGGHVMFAEEPEDGEPDAGGVLPDGEREGQGGDDDEQDDDDDDDDEPFLPVRIVQNLFGRLWGRSAPVDSDSEHEDREGRREDDLGGGDDGGGEGPRATDVD